MPISRHVAMIRTAISPRLAMSILSNIVILCISLHPEYPKPHYIVPDGGVQCGGYGKPQDIAGVRRVEDTVIPQVRCAVVGITLHLGGIHNGLPDSLFFLGSHWRQAC